MLDFFPPKIDFTLISSILAFYTILSPMEVLGSEAVAVTFANRSFGMFAFLIPSNFDFLQVQRPQSSKSFRFLVFVALSTFGAVNGILLTSSRLFYAGACEGQMPEILTMIQIQRLTPAPAVLAISLVRTIDVIRFQSLNEIINNFSCRWLICAFLIFSLWLIMLDSLPGWVLVPLSCACHGEISHEKLLSWFKPFWIFQQASIHATRFGSTDSRSTRLPDYLPPCHVICRDRSDDRQSSWNGLWMSDDSHQHSRLLCFHRVEEQTEGFPEGHGWVFHADLHASTHLISSINYRSF